MSSANFGAKFASTPQQAVTFSALLPFSPLAAVDGERAGVAVVPFVEVPQQGPHVFVRDLEADVRVGTHVIGVGRLRQGDGAELQGVADAQLRHDHGVFLRDGLDRLVAEDLAVGDGGVGLDQNAQRLVVVDFDAGRFQSRFSIREHREYGEAQGDPHLLHSDAAVLGNELFFGDMETTMNPATSTRLLTGLVAGAGILHLATPQAFDRIVPRVLPGGPRLYTVASGVAELWRSRSWPLRAIAYGRLPLQAALIGQALQVARSGVRR